MNKSCACKGIRTCQVCEEYKSSKEEKKVKHIIDLTCYLKLSIYEEETIRIIKYNIDFREIDFFQKNELINFINEKCQILSKEINLKDNNIDFDKNNIFDGFFVIENCFSENNIQNLIKEIDSNPWTESQSGRKKQDYGPKINYKKRKVKSINLNQEIIPEYIKTYISNNLFNLKPDILSNYYIAGVGNLFYPKNQGAHIDPHIDDSWVWGRRIIGVNLLSETIMTFSIYVESTSSLYEINIPIKNGEVYIMSDCSRYIWKHGIKKENIFQDRMVITIREFENNYKTKLI